jgi:SulP family sulfate permease
MRFRPVLIDSLRGYTRRRFADDVLAGAVVGVVALPLAMAFAIASGVPPGAGIFTAIIAGFIISAFGGSRVQIGGPTGAFVVIIYDIVLRHGIEKLMLCTLMAGVILLIMGLARFGRIIKFIPYPVTMGFTSGIAVIIVTGQIKDFLGLPIDSLPADFIGKIGVYLHNFDGIHIASLLVGLASVLLLFLWPKKLTRVIPASILVLVFAALANQWFGLGLDTIGSRFGGIPRSIPGLQFPEISLTLLRELIGPATTIALLGAIESLLSAVVADGLTDDRHDSDQELIAQGLANMVCPLFGGIPATGAIARTATNVRCGATSPVSGIVHAAVLLIFVLAAAPLASLIPMVGLAAILLVVAGRMGEWHLFRRIHHLPSSDALVFLTTFGLTIVFDLTIAVEVGIVLSALLFIRRVSEVSFATAVQTVLAQDAPLTRREPQIHEVPPEVEVYHIKGAFFFGTAEKLETTLRRARQETHTLILALDEAIDIDATGLNALEGLHDRLRRAGRRLIICGIRPHVNRTLLKAKFIERLGPDNVKETLAGALAAAIARGARADD